MDITTNQLIMLIRVYNSESSEEKLSILTEIPQSVRTINALRSKDLLVLLGGGKKVRVTPKGNRLANRAISMMKSKHHRKL